METGDLFILQWTKKSRMHSWVFRRTIQRKNGKTGVRCSSVTWGKPALLSAIQPRTKITIFLLQSSKRFSPLLRHVTEYASFLLTYETLATKGLDSYMGYNTHLLLYVWGHRAAGPWFCKETTFDQIYPNQNMNTDPGELLLCSGISIVGMFSILECFLTNLSHPQEEHEVLISTHKAFTFLLSVKEREMSRMKI